MKHILLLILSIFPIVRATVNFCHLFLLEGYFLTGAISKNSLTRYYEHTVLGFHQKKKARQSGDFQNFPDHFSHSILLMLQRISNKVYWSERLPCAVTELSVHYYWRFFLFLSLSPLHLLFPDHGTAPHKLGNVYLQKQFITNRL